MTSDAEQRAEPATTVVARYETLRAAALGDALPPEARSGLVLFLRRGMWGWARAMATASSSQQAIRASMPGSSSTAAHEHQTMIRLFAAMAMNSEHTGAR